MEARYRDLRWANVYISTEVLDHNTSSIDSSMALPADLEILFAFPEASSIHFSSTVLIIKFGFRVTLLLHSYRVAFKACCF